MDERDHKAMNKKRDKIVGLVEEIAISFYLWMQEKGYDHNIKPRVEKRFTEFMTERYKNMTNDNNTTTNS